MTKYAAYYYYLSFINIKFLKKIGVITVQIKKQILGYNCQQVDGFLHATEKQQQEELNKINARINACQQNNQKQIADLSILLQQVEDYRKFEQEITARILELVQMLEDNHNQAGQNIDGAQKQLIDKLADLSDSYRIIEDVKIKLADSHQQLEALKQTEDFISLHGKTSRREMR